MVVLEKHIAENVAQKIRVSDYLVNKFSIITTRKGIKKALKSQRILQNKKPAYSGNYVQEQDCFELTECIEKPPKIFPLQLSVAYEDDFLAIIEKPAGIVVSGNKYKTVVNALAYNLKPSEEKDALPYFQPIHRLDVATSGLLIIAKTYACRIELGKMLENRQINKIYRAVVQNRLEGFGQLNTPINGKKSLSSFKGIHTQKSKRNGYLSVLELSPITGRTHQLRIHLSLLGFPIVGDKLYGNKNNMLKHKGLFLAAVSVSFIHPIKHKKVVATIEQPLKFKALLKREEIN